MEKGLTQILYDTIAKLNTIELDKWRGLNRFYYRFRVIKKIKSMRADLRKVLNTNEYTASDIHNFILFIHAANVLDMFKDDGILFTCPKPEYAANPSNPSTGRLYAKTNTSDGGFFEVTFIPVLHLQETEVRIEWTITNTNGVSEFTNDITSIQNFHSTMKSITNNKNPVIRSDKDILDNNAYVLLRALFNKCIEIISGEMEMRYLYGKK